MGGGGYCSALTTALIVAALSFSAFAVMELDLTFVDLMVPPALLFYFTAILFGSESNLDLIALDNLFQSLEMSTKIMEKTPHHPPLNNAK